MYNWNVSELIQKNLLIAVSRAGITQREFAKQLGVSEMTVSNWMCGRTTPSLEAISRICESLNISIQSLFSEHELPDESPKEDRKPDDVVMFQELNFIYRDKKRGFTTRYSLRTWPIPRVCLKGHSEEEMRLLHLYGDQYEPYFKEDDLLLIQCQNKVQDGDVVYMVKNNGVATIRKLSLTETTATFIPFDPKEKRIQIAADKLKTMNIYGRVIQVIRMVSPFHEKENTEEIGYWAELSR